MSLHWLLSYANTHAGFTPMKYEQQRASSRQPTRDSAIIHSLNNNTPYPYSPCTNLPTPNTHTHTHTHTHTPNSSIMKTFLSLLLSANHTHTHTHLHQENITLNAYVC